ncbi:MAG: phosphatidate cytidylyltransferase [Bacteroides sp.]|nr:phosphatidate cytidylyltransferase [Lachnospiraceae bacterium]MCM1333014.1 phosphatidate cytidylyltransferase [Bacteroides sp.]MCM1390061.1 phosphatidate cytidylyltransferase [Bacteroides sp.]
MKNILLRSISGAIYVGLIVGGILAGKWSFLALCALFAGLGIMELHHLHSNKGCDKTQTVIDTIGGIILVAGTWQSIFFGIHYILAAYLLYIMARIVYQLYRTGDTPMRDLAYSMLSQMYVALPLAMIMFIYAYSPAIVLSMFIFIWLNDTGAFVVGSLLGKHRLFPRLSPKKSWEGFWGGLAICVIAAIIIESLLPDFFTGMNMIQAIVFSLIAVVFSTWGDLTESMFKRNFDMKDSGHLIPGHGGILDRIDSLLLVIPATLCYIILIG